MALKDDIDKALTLKETAMVLNVGAVKVRQLATSRQLTHHRIGRRFFFRRGDVEQFLEARRISAK